MTHKFEEVLNKMPDSFTTSCFKDAAKRADLGIPADLNAELESYGCTYSSYKWWRKDAFKKRYQFDFPHEGE